MTCLNSTNKRVIQIEEPDPEIWGGGVIFQVRVTRNSFGTKVALTTKVDPGRLDPDLQVAQYHNVLYNTIISS